MTFTPAKDSHRNRILSFLGSPYPLRYGVVVIILATLGYAFLDFLPMLRYDLQLLHETTAVDVQGLRVQDQLQLQIQQNRRDFLRVILAGNSVQERERKIQSMHVTDATIAETESRLSTMGDATRSFQPQFHERWQRYIAQRETLLAAILQTGPEAARAIDATFADSAFVSAQQSVENAESALETSADANLHEVSKALSLAQRELFLLTALKISVLLLLFWMDWRRVRAERQLRRTRLELQASEDRFRQAFDAAVVGMGIFTLDGTVLSVNRMGARMLGCTPAELIGRKVGDFMAPEFREPHLQQIANLPASNESSYVAERRILRKDGSTAWVRNSVTLMLPEGEEGYYFSISEEITVQKEANDRLAWLANYDPVTNLPNRRFFEEQLAAALKPAVGQSKGMALMYLEIDSFDFLKGTFGRATADEILSELGAQLKASQQEGELAGRLDDYAFGMLVPAALYDQATVARAGQLREIVRRVGEAGKHRIPISVSIGIAYSNDALTSTGSLRAVIPESDGCRDDADTLLKYARAAMFEARSQGGDAIYLADPVLQERALQRHKIESALLRGLRQDEFRAVFQPQFQLATGKLIRFEALCRWNSSELGPIPPDRFIPIAEQTGLIGEIGRRIMLEALRQACTWTESGRRIGIAINISPMQFMRPDFTTTLADVLAQTQFPPALLELEITEGIFIRDLNLAGARIRELQRLGVSIALDDFGTGYSSLSYLQRMPIDAVKLDRSFVGDLTRDTATISMVRSVLTMARALNLRVITEGVETQQQYDILRDLGCDEAQGFLLGRPESAELALRRVLDSPQQTVATHS
jgi:PAS domain S-box-containing protein/diguanylate cyclase (GGDEF)-like protein